MVFSFAYLKALKYIAAGKKAKTEHPTVKVASAPCKTLDSAFKFLSEAYFSAFGNGIISEAALSDAASVSSRNPIVPSESTLRSHLQELQTECDNASFRLQFFFKQRNSLMQQIEFVKSQLETHYCAGT